MVLKIHEAIIRKVQSIQGLKLSNTFPSPQLVTTRGIYCKLCRIVSGWALQASKFQALPFCNNDKRDSSLDAQFMLNHLNCN